MGNEAHLALQYYPEPSLPPQVLDSHSNDFTGSNDGERNDTNQYRRQDSSGSNALNMIYFVANQLIIKLRNTHE